MFNSSEIQILKDTQKDSIIKGELLEEQLDIIYQHKWFNIWVPVEYGGKELSLIEGLNLLESLAYIDGGLAWTVTLCSGANMFAGFLDPKEAKNIFLYPKACWGGSGRASGTANWDGEQYIINGEWQYATGAPHLTHFTLNARILDHGMQLKNENGEPLVYSFYVPKDQVLIHNDWNTFGLECTASHSFSLHDAKVSKQQAFILDPNEKQSQSTLYNIPFIPFAEITLLVNYVGMFRRFLDLVEKYFFQKSQDPHWANKYSKERFKLLDQVQVDFQRRREEVFEIAKAIWENAQSLTEKSETIYNELSRSSREFVKIIREQIVLLFPLLGINGADKENELNIIFRNIFTASQHSLLNI